MLGGFVQTLDTCVPEVVVNHSAPPHRRYVSNVAGLLLGQPMGSPEASAQQQPPDVVATEAGAALANATSATSVSHPAEAAAGAGGTVEGEDTVPNERLTCWRNEITGATSEDSLRLVLNHVLGCLPLTPVSQAPWKRAANHAHGVRV